MSKITGYTALTAVASGDLLPIVDVSDPAMGGTGTTKNITVANLTALTTQLDSNPTDIQPAGTQAAGTSPLAARADHVHASAAIAPTDTGIITWTMDPANAGGTTAALAAGKLMLAMFWVRKTATITTITIYIQNAGVTLTSGQNLAGIYNSAGTLLGSTADRTTAWTAGGLDAMTVTAPFSASPGAYWCALLSNGSTPPSPKGTTPAYPLVNANQGISVPRMGTYGSGLTALPATITPASISTTSPSAYCALFY